MTNQHPITPSPELVRQWESEFYGVNVAPGEASIALATQAARWGADQELEACCADIHTVYGKGPADWIRSLRRPKPPSLKEQALEAQQRMWNGTSNHDDWNLIRRALEQLDD